MHLPRLDEPSAEVAAEAAAEAAADAPHAGMAAASMPLGGRIETPRLLLRYLRADDVAALMPILSDAAVTRYLSYLPWANENDGRAWCEEFAETNRTGDTAWFVCIDRASGRMIGNCVLFNLEPSCARAELGYMFGRAWWRQGFAQEAAGALIAYGFKYCRLQRIEAQIHVANTASQQLIAKLGFQREGLLRKRLANNQGVLHDVYMYSLLRDTQA